MIKIVSLCMATGYTVRVKGDETNEGIFNEVNESLWSKLARVLEVVV